MLVMIHAVFSLRTKPKFAVDTGMKEMGIVRNLATVPGAVEVPIDMSDYKDHTMANVAEPRNLIDESPPSTKSADRLPVGAPRGRAFGRVPPRLPRVPLEGPSMNRRRLFLLSVLLLLAGG